MVENVIQIKIGITIRVGESVKYVKKYVKKIIFGILLHVLVKVVNVYQVLLTIQWLSGMKL